MQFKDWHQLGKFDGRDLLPKGDRDSGHETHRVPTTVR